MLEGDRLLVLPYITMGYGSSTFGTIAALPPNLSEVMKVSYIARHALLDGYAP